MPFYEYRCDKGHTFEVMQRMTDDPVSDCERCGRPVQRVFHPVAVHFKGSGFYNTDYGKQKKKGGSDTGESSSSGSGDSGSGSGSDSSSSGSSDSGSKSKSESKSSSGS